MNRKKLPTTRKTSSANAKLVMRSPRSFVAASFPTCRLVAPEIGKLGNLPPLLDRPTPAEAGVDLVPVRHRRLAQLPAQAHFPAIDHRREIDEPDENILELRANLLDFGRVV